LFTPPLRRFLPFVPLTCAGDLDGRRGARAGPTAAAEAAGRLGRPGLAAGRLVSGLAAGPVGRRGLCGGPDLCERRVMLAFIHQIMLNFKKKQKLPDTSD